MQYHEVPEAVQNTLAEMAREEGDESLEPEIAQVQVISRDNLSIWEKDELVRRVEERFAYGLTASGSAASTAALPAETTVFGRALEGLRGVAARPELVLEEVPAPTRLAPHAVALSGEVVPSYLDEDDGVTAQEFRATVRGRVVDSSQGSVPGTMVVVRNQETNEVATATTNQEGSYTIPFLRPGIYTLTAELA